MKIYVYTKTVYQHWSIIFHNSQQVEATQISIIEELIW
jgi:hypothetical protein